MNEQSAEFWRRAGFELVMRHGTPEERFDARSRLEYVLACQRQTEKWLAERQRAAA